MAFARRRSRSRRSEPQSVSRESRFIGERGYYPSWARRNEGFFFGPSGGWLFQRTLFTAGESHRSFALFYASNNPVIDQVIVWLPMRRFPILGQLPSVIHRERQLALNDLEHFRLVCFGQDCRLTSAGSSRIGLATKSVVHEQGLWPEHWLLKCPSCGAGVGPDLAHISAAAIIDKWRTLGQPQLQDPGAAPEFEETPPIRDLPAWAKKSKPYELELAYIGQQLWSDIPSFLTAMTEASQCSR